MNILFTRAGELPDEILTYLFNIILETSEDVIICQIPFFVDLIKKFGYRHVVSNKIFKLLNDTRKSVYHTMWYMNVLKENSSASEINNIDSFLELFDENISKEINQNFIFYTGLMNNLHNPNRYLASNLARYGPVVLPYEPDVVITGYDTDGIRVETSNSKPVIIPFITTKGRINILFKRESVLNDYTVLNIMRINDIVLRDAVDPNFSTIVYSVMPITADTGIVEIVDNSETIYSITKNGTTIFQHIMENNSDSLVGTIMDRYMYSLITYTLNSYFIGLGDRHLQNVMVTNDGSIFHIDFGFILGADAYPVNAYDIKLNRDILETVGGNDSVRYNKYLRLCCVGTVILRKMFNLYFILMSQCPIFTEKRISRFILLPMS
jgi:hypothetical protein